MATIENVTLIDDIRKDALLLMQSRGISYEEAFDLARENLIGKSNVTEFEAKKFDVDLEDDLVITEDIFEEIKDVEDSSIPYYLEIVEKELQGVVNPKDYTNDQIKAIVVAHQMGADLKKFISNIYSPEQINFIAILQVTGEDISRYINNNNFDINDETLIVYGKDQIKELAQDMNMEK